MSKFGNLIGGETTEIKPVVETPVVEEVVVAEVPPTPEEEVADTVVSPLDFGSMSKDELEDYGRTIGIELDRRLSKKKLIQQLEDHIQYIESI